MNFNFNIDPNNIISFLTSPEIQVKLFPLKIAFLAVSLAFLGFIIFAVSFTHYFQWLFFQDFVQFFSLRPFGAKRINRTWNKILKRLETGSESEYRLAVIEADDMLNNSLNRMGYSGKTLGERLEKLTSATLSNIEQIHQAHKTRDSIVHDPDYRLSLDETRKTLEIYQQAFRDLQILV